MKKDFDYSNARMLEIQDRGEEHTGRYTVNKGMVTVISYCGRKSTQLGNLPADILARTMLHELVRQ